MSITTRARRGLVTALSLTLAAGALMGSAWPAAAAEVVVDDVQFRWGVNNESNNSAFAPGTFNYFSAGKLGNPGAGGVTLPHGTGTDGSIWSNGEPAGWSASAANVSIEKKQADASYAPATFQGLKTSPTGGSINPPTSQVFSDHQVVIDAGEGTVDPEANTADIAWDGDFSIVFYSGMSFFYVSDPQLEVDSDGTGTVTATLSGYGSSMDDMEAWNPLTPQEVTLATLSDVEVTDTGFTVTPDYLDVAYDSGEFTDQTAKSDSNAAHWGSFPQSFVDFTQQVGAGPYWYSSGGAVDRNKPTLPLEVKIPVPVSTPDPTVELDIDEIAVSGTTTITATGAGFDPALSPAPSRPTGLSSGGVYVVLGRASDGWAPSDGGTPTSAIAAVESVWALPEADRTIVPSAVPLGADGTFSQAFEVTKAQVDALANPDGQLGVYTFTRSSNPAFETFTPVTVAEPTATTTTLTTKGSTYGKRGSLAVTVKGADSGQVRVTGGGWTKTLPVDANGRAANATPINWTPGTRTLKATYLGTDTTTTSAATATHRVAKGTPSVRRLGTVARPTRTKNGWTKVRITSSGPATSTGHIRAVLVRGGKTYLGPRTPLNSRGEVNRAVVRKAPKGTYRLEIRYYGDARLNAATGARGTITIR